MKAFLDKIEKKLIWIYPVLALILYWPTRHAGFVHDFTGWYERYQEHGWSGILHCFGYHRLQHFMHFLHFLIYKAFDTSPLPWYFIYAVLFGLNAYLVFKVSEWLVRHFNSNDYYLPYLASFFFLIHPYHTTTVVWKVCFHYLLATFFILTIVLLTLQWLNSPSRKKITLLYSCYILALFTHEVAISVPLITLTFIAQLYMARHKLRKKAIFYLLLPQFLILPLYFSLTPHLLSDTGKEPLLTGLRVDMQKQSSAVLQYASKHVLFTRYWSHPAKEQWKRNLSTWPYIIAGCVSLAFLLLLFIRYYEKTKPNIKIGWFAFIAFVAAIGPFTSVYIYYVQYATNDRYGFTASAFIIISLVAFIRCLPNRINQVIFLLYGCLSFIFLSKTIYYWHESAHVMNSLLEDFRWYDREKVYVLAGPDNFKGVLMMTTTEGGMLDDHLYVKDKKYPDCEIEDLMQFNMATRSDGVSVIVHTPDSLSVKLNQWGTWFWRYGLGASSYETDKFNVKLSPPYYRLKRKIKEEDAVFIYQDGDKWKEVEGW